MVNGLGGREERQGLCDKTRGEGRGEEGPRDEEREHVFVLFHAALGGHAIYMASRRRTRDEEYV